MNPARWRTLLLALAFFALGAVEVRAQDHVVALAVLDRSTAGIGDALLLTLSVDVDPGYQVLDPGVTRVIGDFEVLETLRARQDRRASGSARLTFRYRVATYRLGERTLPPIDVSYQDPGGSRGAVRTLPQTVLVESVIAPNEDATDIRPLGPQLALPGGALPGLARALSLAAAAVGAGTLALAVGIVLLRRRGRKTAVAGPATTPVQRAIAEIERIDRLALAAKGQYREHYSLVAAALRTFLREQFGLAAHERTARELRRDMERSRIERRLREPMAEVLREAEIARFHRAIPYPRHAEEAARAALAALRRAAAAERKAIEDYELAGAAR